MLATLRIVTLSVCALPLIAQTMPLPIPAKPILSRPQSTSPTTNSKPLNQFPPSRTSSAYTLAQPADIAKGACATTTTVTERKWFFFENKLSVLRYVDGQRERSVSIYVRNASAISNFPLPSQIESGLKQCLVSETASDEESLRSKVNVCLQSNRASFEVSYLTVSTGDLQCPPEAAQK